MNSIVTMSTMHNAANFEDRGTLKMFLAEQLNAGSLVVVLGAGASLGFGLPDWTVLVDRAFKLHGTPRPPGLSNQIAADTLLQLLGSDELRFANLVREALYQDADLSLSQLRKTNLLAALGALAMASSRGSVNRIVSFNFDDLLERYLAFYGFDAIPVVRMPAWQTRRDVAVYHIHGLLPSDRSIQASEPIVLAQIHYDNIVGRFNNLWRAAFIEICRSSTCLFVGLSGTDPNLTSVIAEVKDTHASNARGDAFWGVRFGAKIEQAPFWQARGVYQQTVADYSEVPEFLFDICQIAASRRAARH